MIYFTVIKMQDKCCRYKELFSILSQRLFMFLLILKQDFESRAKSASSE